jgi:hypothetical protein
MALLADIKLEWACRPETKRSLVIKGFIVQALGRKTLYQSAFSLPAR